MCGIVGIAHLAAETGPVEPALLERMRDTLRHRGPDDAGVWVNSARDVGFGHRRLSIVDLSPDGRQPMCNEDKSVWITFNGEIYNHVEWRPVLERKGHRFRSRSDTEVIIHLYEEFGPACVERLDGMFAFGLWDERAGTLLLARDRLGVKPLYYTRQAGMLVFASEIKALLSHPAIGPGMDLESLGHYLALKTVPAPRTLFAGVSKLAAGATLTCDRAGRVEHRTYWDAVNPEHGPVGTRDRDEGESIARVRGLLDDAVSKRLMSDVPLGVFLSGGLDSSAIVGLMAAQAGRPVNTFSIGLSDLDGYDELPYARQVAERFRTHHHEARFGKQELIDYLPTLARQQDEPLADPVCVPLYYLSCLARDAGVKVVLVGEGSDEQFLGYESRINFLRRYRWTWGPLRALPPGVLRGLHAAAGWLNGATGVGGRARRILGKASRGDEVFLGSVAFGEDALGRLLGEPAAGLVGGASRAVAETARPLRTAWPDAEIASRMSYVDLKIRIAELLLMRIDKVTMSVGLEAREPFLDYHLVEYLMTLRASLKLKGWEPKYVLKRAVADVVPESILRRPKQAFAAPVGDWLRRGLDAYAAPLVLDSRLRQLGLFRYDVIEHMLSDHVAGRADHGVSLWNLMNLSAWYDCWFPN